MDDDVVEVEEESWCDRLSGSLGCICLGIILFFGSFPLLYWNEGRAVARYDALHEGESMVVSINATVIDSSTNGKLVYITTDLSTSNNSVITDPVFGVVTTSNLKLERNVEMYQWSETSKTSTKKNVGGSTTKTTTYSYNQRWSSTLINSDNFQRGGHNNPSSMPYSSETWAADTIYAGVHVLPPEIVNKINWFTPYTNISTTNIPDSTLQSQVTTYGNNGFYISTTSISRQKKSLEAAATTASLGGINPKQSVYDRLAPYTALGPNYNLRATHDLSQSNPQIGDVRVTFEVVQPGQVSIIAQQNGDTFGAYETSNGETLLFVQQGDVSAEEIFENAVTSNKIMTWLLRFVGLFVMWLGIDSMLHPLEVFMDVIPCLGDMMSAAINLVAFLFTLVFGGLTIAIAWLIHHPTIGLIVLAVFLGLVGGVFFIIRMMQNKKKQSKSDQDDDDAQYEKDALALAEGTQSEPED